MLVGISASGNEVTALAISLKQHDHGSVAAAGSAYEVISSTIIATESFQDNERVTACTSFRSTTPTILSVQEDAPYRFITGHANGIVKFWNASGKDLPSFSCAGTFAAHDGAIVNIASASLTRFVTVAKVVDAERASTREMRVWEMASCHFLFQVEDTILLVPKVADNQVHTDFLAKKKEEREAERSLRYDNGTIRHDHNVHVAWIPLLDGTNVLIVGYYVGPNLEVQNKVVGLEQLCTDEDVWHISVLTHRWVGEKEGNVKWCVMPRSLQVVGKLTSIQWMTGSSALAIAIGSVLCSISTWQLMCLDSKCTGSSLGDAVSVVNTNTSYIHALLDEEKSSLGKRNEERRALTQECVMGKLGLASFHPRVLVEYMMSARFEIVNAVLEHLLDECKRQDDKTSQVISDIPFGKLLKLLKVEFDVEMDEEGEKSTTDTNDNTFSSSSSSSTSMYSSSTFSIGGSFSATSSAAPKYGFLSRAAPPPAASTARYGFLSSRVGIEQEPSLTLSSGVENEDAEKDSSRRGGKDSVGTSAPKKIFSAEKARLLEDFLTRMAIPGVNRKEQVLMLAIVDTLIFMQEKEDALDECGLRFLVKYKLYSFLKKSRAGEPEDILLTPADYCWALHSDSQSEIVATCVPLKCDWPHSRSLGVGYWLRSRAELVTHVTNLAKQHFLKNHDPNDCLLFYTALGKLRVLADLFQSCKMDRFADFFRHDFKEERWRVAALKNAYALMSKHRHELAAAYFILAGSLSDGVHVCIKNMKDPQLGLVICRLVEGDSGPVYYKIMKEVLLPLAEGRVVEGYPVDAAEKSIWKASIFHWLGGNKREALDALLPTTTKQSSSTFGVGGRGGEVDDEEELKIGGTVSHQSVGDGTTIHFVNYLRNDSILRQQEVDYALEIALHRKTQYLFYCAGALGLAFEQAVELKKKKKLQQKKEKEKEKPVVAAAAPRRGAGGFSFSAFSYGAAPVVDESAKKEAKKRKYAVGELFDGTLRETIAMQVLLRNVNEEAEKVYEEEENMRRVIRSLRIVDMKIAPESIADLDAFEELREEKNEKDEKGEKEHANKDEKEKGKETGEHKGVQKGEEKGKDEKKDAEQDQAVIGADQSKKDGGGDSKKITVYKPPPLMLFNAFFTAHLFDAVYSISRCSLLPREDIYRVLSQRVYTLSPLHQSAIKTLYPYTEENNTPDPHAISTSVSSMSREITLGLFSFISGLQATARPISENQSQLLIDIGLNFWMFLIGYRDVLTDPSAKLHPHHLASILAPFLICNFFAGWSLGDDSCLALTDSINYDCFGWQHYAGDHCAGMRSIVKRLTSFESMLKFLLPVIQSLFYLRGKYVDGEDQPSSPGPSEASARKGKKKMRIGGPSKKTLAEKRMLEKFLRTFLQTCQLRAFIRTIEHVLLSVAFDLPTFSGRDLSRQQKSSTVSDSDWVMTGSSPSSPIMGNSPFQLNGKLLTYEEVKGNLHGNVDHKEASGIAQWLFSFNWSQILQNTFARQVSVLESAGQSMCARPDMFGLPSNTKQQIRYSLLEFTHKLISQSSEFSYMIDKKAKGPYNSRCVWDFLSYHPDAILERKQGANDVVDITASVSIIEDVGAKCWRVMDTDEWTDNAGLDILIESPASCGTVYQVRRDITNLYTL